jgi:hypothetical protein
MINLDEEYVNHVHYATEFAAKDAKTTKKHERHWKDIVPKHYHKYESVFTKEGFDELPPRRPWDHAIELVPRSEAVDSRLSSGSTCR